MKKAVTVASGTVLFALVCRHSQAIFVDHTNLTILAMNGDAPRVMIFASDVWMLMTILAIVAAAVPCIAGSLEV